MAVSNNRRRRAPKSNEQAEYTKRNNQGKRSIKADKWEYEDLVMTPHKASREGNIKQSWHIEENEAVQSDKEKIKEPITDVQE
ncbi:unnamed protein product [Schistosoma mattheei]|uniref:Uncharacterized protein n=1 Tax=Schistosoma mattheei TaxID=31246 RepID=A0A183PM50_9TREM|nr:unnamed protein product [Schistosoma mattheei]